MNNARPGDAEYLQYYGTLANSATPAEYGRFWRKILKGDLFPIAQRDQFLQILSGNAGSSYTGSINSSTNYTRIGTKNGSKYRVHSWVAVAWDQSRASGISEATDRARYSLSFFTEEWPLPSGSNTTTVTSLAQPLIASLAGEAINHLKAAAR
jgi:hypothetical protein